MTAPKERKEAFEAILKDFTQNENGKDVYSNDKALYGYIDANKFMILPPLFDAHFTATALPDVDVEELGKENAIANWIGANARDKRDAFPYFVMKDNDEARKALFGFTLFNYIALKKVYNDEFQAYIVAAFRARWVSLGCYFFDDNKRASLFKESREATAEEVAVVTKQMADFEDDSKPDVSNDVTQLLEYFNDPNYGRSFIVNKAETIWGISEYLVRVFGHHYKPELESRITKAYTSAFEGSEEFPMKIQKLNLFHTAIHPFGLRALPILAYKFASYGKFGNAILLRTSGGPNGCAKITTTAAGITCIKTEPWYQHFEQTYGEQIAYCEEAAKSIKNNKYKYHLTASAYGLSRATHVKIVDQNVPLQTVVENCAAVAPIVQGFILAVSEYSTRDVKAIFAMGQAKAIEIAASSNPMLAMKIKALVAKGVAIVEEQVEMKSAIIQAFPSTQSEVPQ